MIKLFLSLLMTIFAQLALGNTFTDDLVQAVIKRTAQQITYDGRYLSIPYPNGDVPSNIGVCTDVIIRAYRAIGTDLQKLVHEDMAANFNAYPSKRIWGLNSTDRNIDHRRVPNLQVFLTRQGINSQSLIRQKIIKRGTWSLGWYPVIYRT